VIVDATHKRWAIAAAVALAISVLIYIPYALRPVRPTGGSALGLAYGIAGFAGMVFVTLLSLRKKFPIWRIGRTQTWMRGHLWIGALTLPLILLHAAFSWGHGLTLAMMWLFAIVYASGVFGAWVQQTVPRRLTGSVLFETIYDEIAHVRAQLLDEGDTIVADACGKLQVVAAVPTALAAEASAKAALASVMRLDADDTAALREFYINEMRPFLQHPGRHQPFANAIWSQARFAKLRPLLPPAIHPAVADLESICEEERQLFSQERLHGVLHGWLIVHVPLSFALMALAVVHIIGALRY
jgi:hypothetical protein